jgi:ribose transport system substrate-binding protein
MVLSMAVACRSSLTAREQGATESSLVAEKFVAEMGADRIDGNQHEGEDMSIRMKREWLFTALCLLLASVALTACGGSSGGGSTSESTASGSSAGEASGLAASKKVIAPFVGHPNPFPVVDKLKELPKGATVAYMDCGVPGCAIIYQLVSEAAKTMGVSVSRIKAGLAANTVSAAFDSVVADKPSAVIVPAIGVELWSKQLKQELKN